MPIVRKRQDWGLWLSIIKETKNAYGIKDQYLAIYRDSNGLSANKLQLVKDNFNLYHEVQGFNVFVSLVLLCGYFFHTTL